MTNFEKWRQNLTPEAFLYSGYHAGTPFKACTIRCSSCPADDCPRKDLGNFIHDAICEGNWLAWCNTDNERNAEE